MKYTEGISNHSRNTDDSLGSGTKLLLPSWLLDFRHRREDPTTRGALPRPNWSRLGSNLNSLLFSKYLNTLFSKCPLLGMTSFTSPVLFPIRGFYHDICDCHIFPACTWIPALMSSPTHALSRMVFSLTKPKDKTYKKKNDNINKIHPQLYNTISTQQLVGWLMFNDRLIFESESTFTGWRHRIPRNCCRSTTRRHASPIPLYHLSRQRA